MNIIQIVYFGTAALLIAGVAYFILLPALRDGDFSRVYSHVMISFVAKMVLGAVTMIVAWKLLHWSVKLSAIGSISAYMVALMITTFAAFNMMKRGGR